MAIEAVPGDRVIATPRQLTVRPVALETCVRAEERDVVAVDGKPRSLAIAQRQDADQRGSENENSDPDGLPAVQLDLRADYTSPRPAVALTIDRASPIFDDERPRSRALRALHADPRDGRQGSIDGSCGQGLTSES